MAANGYQLHILMGNLGADPKVHTTRSGQKVCNFDIAVNEKNSDGTEVTTWYSIAAWNGLGEVCAQYLKKGRSVMVEGTRMNCTGWLGRDNNLYTRMELTANEVKFLGNGNSGHYNGNGNSGHYQGNGNGGHYNGNHNGGHHNGNHNGVHHNGNPNRSHHNGNHSSQQRQAAPQQRQPAPQQRPVRQPAPQQRRQAAPQQRQAAPQQRQAAPQQRQPQQRRQAAPQQRQAAQTDEWQYSVPNDPDEIPF